MEYFSEIETEFENTLACLSGAQMGLNHEKTGGRKSRDTLPLRKYSTYGIFFNPLERCPGYPVGLISDLFYRYPVYGRKPDMASRPAEYLVVKIAENPTKYAARPF